MCVFPRSSLFVLGIFSSDAQMDQMGGAWPKLGLGLRLGLEHVVLTSEPSYVKLPVSGHNGWSLTYIVQRQPFSDFIL